MVEAALCSTASQTTSQCQTWAAQAPSLLGLLLLMSSPSLVSLNVTACRQTHLISHALEEISPTGFHNVTVVSRSPVGSFGNGC